MLAGALKKRFLKIFEHSANNLNSIQNLSQRVRGDITGFKNGSLIHQFSIID